MPHDDIDEESIRGQAEACEPASAEMQIPGLPEIDAERLAIQEGLDAIAAGRSRPFEDFDREFRKRNGLSPRA